MNYSLEGEYDSYYKSAWFCMVLYFIAYRGYDIVKVQKIYELTSHFFAVLRLDGKAG